MLRWASDWRRQTPESFGNRTSFFRTRFWSWASVGYVVFLGCTVCYILFGLEMLAKVVTTPFQRHVRRELTRCSDAEIFILDTLGEENLPEAIQPNNFVRLFEEV